jgi:hypothetical protein
MILLKTGTIVGPAPQKLRVMGTRHASSDGSFFNTAFSCQIANVIYHVTSGPYGHPAYLELHGTRGGLKRLDLGFYVRIEQGQQACERHYGAGRNLTKAKKTLP